MIKLMSNYEVDRLKMNNNEVNKRKNAWEKRKELVFRRGSCLIHHLQNISHQKGGVVLPGISKMNDSVKEETQFSPKNTLVKGKWFW